MAVCWCVYDCVLVCVTYLCNVHRNCVDCMFNVYEYLQPCIHSWYTTYTQHIHPTPSFQTHIQGPYMVPTSLHQSFSHPQVAMMGSTPHHTIPPDVAAAATAAVHAQFGIPPPSPLAAAALVTHKSTGESGGSLNGVWPQQQHIQQQQLLQQQLQQQQQQQQRDPYNRSISAFSSASMHATMPASQTLGVRAQSAPGFMSGDLSMDLSLDLPKLPSLLMDSEMLSTSPDKIPGLSGT